MSEYLNNNQRIAYEKILEGINVCIIGKGGSGKSYICDLINESDVLFVSPTGMAALNLGEHARTIHSTLMLGSKSMKAWSWGNISTYIEQNKYKLIEFFNKYRMIVFDEGSMIISGLFESYVRLFHTIYETDSGNLFNGKQIVMLLDPLQLPPIKNNSAPYLDFNNRNVNCLDKKLCKHDLIVECPEFKSLFNKDNIIHLHENMRCTDPEWDEVLQGCRLGFTNYSREEKDRLLKLLNERVFTYSQTKCGELSDIYPNSLKTTLKRNTITTINKSKIKELIDSGNENHIISREILIDKDKLYANNSNYFDDKNKSDKVYDESINYMDDLNGYYSEREEQENGRITGFVLDFNVVIGCRIMYRKNDEDIRNGSLGYISSFVLDENNNVETIRVKFDKKEKIIDIKKTVFEHPDHSDIKISAFPIIPAFAITIHKLQAQTIDSPMSILYDKKFIPYHEKKEHLLYTAISRCKRREDVFIICDHPIDESFFPVNRYMYAWYKNHCD